MWQNLFGNLCSQFFAHTNKIQKYQMLSWKTRQAVMNAMPEMLATLTYACQRVKTMDAFCYSETFIQ